MKRTMLYLTVLLLAACNNNNQLPVYGIKKPVTQVIGGKPVIDSIDYTIPPFTFYDQDSAVVDSHTVNGKVYVADFFFTSCPSICPKMKKEMLRIYDKYQTDNNVVLISYSIDPGRDSVARLKSYAQKLGIDNTAKWHMLTGNKDSIYSLADAYLVSAAEDPDAPGGHIHSGNFVLIDKHSRIRGYYDGTDTKKVDKLLTDMDNLLKEE